MTLYLHDTAARAVREFTPITPGEASVYLCGATVQAPPHIGHLRSALCFDVLIRWLEASGYRVTFCRNVTDVEDKILRTAKREGVPPWIVAERNQRAFTWAYDAVGCRPPDIEPRATGHIPEMIVLIRRLIERGHAYQGAGDVYFDVRSYRDYGALSGQRLDQMRPAEDSEGARGRAAPSATRATSRCGRAPSRVSLTGRRRGDPVGRAGTWSARPWPPSTSGRTSTSTAAGWT